jgi:hypothetical protein
MDNQDIQTSVEELDVERTSRLTSAVRRMLISEIKSITNLKAVGVGIGTGLIATIIGIAMIRDRDWSENLDGLIVILGGIAGYVAYRMQREQFAVEVDGHDDQMLRVLYERYERLKATLIICTAVIVGAFSIAVAIVATR